MAPQKKAPTRKKPESTRANGWQEVLLAPAAGGIRAGGAPSPGNHTRTWCSTRGFLFAPAALNEGKISGRSEARRRFVKTSVFPVRPKPGSGKLSRAIAWNFLPGIRRRRGLIRCRQMGRNAGRAPGTICCRRGAAARRLFAIPVPIFSGINLRRIPRPASAPARIHWPRSSNPGSSHSVAVPRHQAHHGVPRFAEHLTGIQAEHNRANHSRK